VSSKRPTRGLHDEYPTDTFGSPAHGGWDPDQQEWDPDQQEWDPDQRGGYEPAEDSYFAEGGEDAGAGTPTTHRGDEWHRDHHPYDDGYQDAHDRSHDRGADDGHDRPDARGAPDVSDYDTQVFERLPAEPSSYDGGGVDDGAQTAVIPRVTPEWSAPAPEMEREWSVPAPDAGPEWDTGRPGAAPERPPLASRGDEPTQESAASGWAEQPDEPAAREWPDRDTATEVFERYRPAARPDVVEPSAVRPSAGVSGAAPPAPVEPEPKPAAPAEDDAERARSTGEPAEPRKPARRPVRQAEAEPGRRRPIVLVTALLLVALLGAGGAYWAWAQQRAAASAHAVRNLAFVDPAATRAVAAQVSEAVEVIYSYDWAQLDQSETRALSFITGDYAGQYRQSFNTVRQQAPKLKAKLTSTVVQAGVQTLTPSQATLLLLVNQEGQRGDNPNPLRAGIQLSVTAVKVDGRWKLFGVTQK
jgi:Mce-associated membrane protein